MNLIKNLFSKAKTVWRWWQRPKSSYPKLDKNVANPTPMSPDTIRICLGLHTWEDYRRSVLERFASLNWIDGDRGTGRTTKLMVEALSYASEGRSVVFVVKTKKEERQVRHKLIAYAKQLGIKQKIRITNNSRVMKIILKGYSKPIWTVVYDHYALGIE